MPHSRFGGQHARVRLDCDPERIVSNTFDITQFGGQYPELLNAQAPRFRAVQGRLRCSQAAWVQWYTRLGRSGDIALAASLRGRDNMTNFLVK